MRRMCICVLWPGQLVLGGEVTPYRSHVSQRLVDKAMQLRVARCSMQTVGSEVLYCFTRWQTGQEQIDGSLQAQYSHRIFMNIEAAPATWFDPFSNGWVHRAEPCSRHGLPSLSAVK